MATHTEEHGMKGTILEDSIPRSKQPFRKNGDAIDLSTHKMVLGEVRAKLNSFEEGLFSEICIIPLQADTHLIQPVISHPVIKGKGTCSAGIQKKIFSLLRNSFPWQDFAKMRAQYIKGGDIRPGPIDLQGILIDNANAGHTG
jgi:hypothetical protein